MSLQVKQSLQVSAKKAEGNQLTLSDEEVEECNNARVTTEHVVTARPHALQRHAEPGPYHQSALQLRPQTTIYLKMHTATYWYHRHHKGWWVFYCWKHRRWNNNTHTHTQSFYCSSGTCPGPPWSAGTRKVTRSPAKARASDRTKPEVETWQRPKKSTLWP